jgi:catechol 2,3-dioxygenase-like lactoylglutathione lyase family enzyme
MPVQVTAIMLGVEDLARSKKFYGEGLGCAIEQDYPNFVKFFRGISFHYIVASREAVDETMGKAVSAGGSVVKGAEAAQWGGYFGYFSDPDGYLWKVASAS